MSRPRIRSVKPEMRQDERYGRMSRDARELFNGLITMADDEGRVRALPAAILGHVFPYDLDAVRKLDGWLKEITDSGMVLGYEDGGIPYLAFRHWRRHQRINKPTPSLLPPPPDPVVVRENSVNPTGELPEESGSATGGVREEVVLPRGGADRIGSEGRTSSSAVAAEPERPDVHRLCHLLADLMRANDPKAKIAPDGKNWRDACRLLLDRDERDPELVERVIRWTQADEFWRGNILSMGKLREQFPQLVLKMPHVAASSDDAARDERFRARASKGIDYSSAPASARQRLGLDPGAAA